MLSLNLGMLSVAALFVVGTHHAASAAEPDSVELSNLAACYADGIDMIGNGKSDAGVRGDNTRALRLCGRFVSVRTLVDTWSD